MSLRELYQEIIIDHGREPRNFGKLAEANHSHDGFNPLCGDKLTVYVQVADHKIVDVKFIGDGCAISVASASLMTEAMKGKAIAEFEHFFSVFHEVITTGKEPSEDIGKLAVFVGVAEYPMRVKCATLAWHTLKAALANDPKPVSTE